MSGIFKNVYTPRNRTRTSYGKSKQSLLFQSQYFPVTHIHQLVKKHTAHAILLAMQRSQNRKPRRVPSATFQKSLVACVLNLDCPVIPLQQNLHREVRFRQRTLDGTQYKPVNRRYLSRIKPSACIVKIRNQIQLHLQPGHMRL